jgi:hypothetical protein
MARSIAFARPTPQAKKVVFAARGAHEAQETTWVP